MQPKRPRAAASRAPQPPSPRTRTPHFQSPTDSSVRLDFPPRAPSTAALCAGNASRPIRKSRRKHPAGGERPSEHPRHGAGVARAAEPARGPAGLAAAAATARHVHGSRCSLQTPRDSPAQTLPRRSPRVSGETRCPLRLTSPRPLCGSDTPSVFLPHLCVLAPRDAANPCDAAGPT